MVQNSEQLLHEGAGPGGSCLAVLRVRDAADAIGSAGCVRRLIRQGWIRGVRVGYSWAIEAAS